MPIPHRVVSFWLDSLVFHDRYTEGVLMFDWTKAPKWANYVAMDESDIWYWYEYLPTLNDCGEWCAQGRIRRVKYDDVDYENSLERRP